MMQVIAEPIWTFICGSITTPNSQERVIQECPRIKRKCWAAYEPTKELNF